MEAQKQADDFPYYCEEIGQVSGWNVSYWKPGTTFLRSTPEKTLVARVMIEPTGFIDLYVYEKGSPTGKKLRHARQEHGVGELYAAIPFIIECDELLQREYSLPPAWPAYLQYLKKFRHGDEIKFDNILAGLRNEVRDHLVNCLSLPPEDREVLENFLRSDASKPSTEEELPDFGECEKVWEILQKPKW